MKAKELMIGDWVYNLHHKENIQITPYDYFTHSHIDGIQSFEHVRIIQLVSGRELIPIPLTPEILEANGFEIKRTIHGDELCRTYKIAGRNLNYCFMYGDDKDVAKVTDPLLTGEIYFYVMYVHELQHALSLCGLNEMADNFKLTKKGDNDNE